MVKAELGTKRTCPSCGSKFYDLLKSPIVCPKCGTSFIAAPLLPSKGELPQAAVAKPREQPKPVAEEAEEVSDVELVSLEEARGPGLAHRHGAEHERAVRDRFVARHANDAREAVGRI